MSTLSLPIGDPAPRFTLEALGSGRTFKIASLQGRSVLLLFVDRHTAHAARELVERLRRRFPDHETLTIAMIIDLASVPKLLRGPAQRFIESSYAEASTLIPVGYDPADHLIMLPDWTGKLFQGYRIQDASKSIAAVLIDKAGIVSAVIQGPDTSDRLLKTLDDSLIDGANET